LERCRNLDGVSLARALSGLKRRAHLTLVLGQVVSCACRLDIELCHVCRRAPVSRTKVIGCARRLVSELGHLCRRAPLSRSKIVSCARRLSSKRSLHLHSRGLPGGVNRNLHRAGNLRLKRMSYHLDLAVAKSILGIAVMRAKYVAGCRRYHVASALSDDRRSVCAPRCPDRFGAAGGCSSQMCEQ
jgi:hypothetical protein